MTGNTNIGMGQSRPLNEKAIDALNDEMPHGQLSTPLFQPGLTEKLTEAARAAMASMFSPAQLQLMKADLGLPGAALDDIYNPEGDGEHPVIKRAMWRLAVEQQETISGYWDWVAHRCAAETAPEETRDAASSPATRQYLIEKSGRIMGNND